MKNTPRVRFKGFSGEWEEKEFNGFATVLMNKRIFKHQTSEQGNIPFFKIGTFGGIADAFISRELFEEYKLKYPYPKKGDILISASGSIGRVVEYIGDDEYFQDSNIVWLEHKQILNNTFLKYFYLIVKWHGLEGSTIKRLYNKNILDTKIQYPQKQEQTKIGNFFKNIDTLIAKNQQKYEKLTQMKKALLEKMFPKAEAKEPEIRFQGFSGEWERKIFNSFVCRTNEQKNIATLPRVEYEDIISGQGQLNKNIYKKFCTKKGMYFTKGDILFGKLRPYLKNWLLANFEGVAVGDFWIYRTVNCDNNFLYVLIQTPKYQYVANLSSGTKMPRSDWSIIKNAKFTIPKNTTEQSKIGELFRLLDKRIALQQDKIEQLKNMKRAFLAKMFV